MIETIVVFAVVIGAALYAFRRLAPRVLVSGLDQVVHDRLRALGAPPWLLVRFAAGRERDGACGACRACAPAGEGDGRGRNRDSAAPGNGRPAIGESDQALR